MDITEFVNNWIRPEVKALIQQYALSSPIDRELAKFMETRKHLKYGWCVMNDYCFTPLEI